MFFATIDGNVRVNEIGDFVAGAVAPLAFFWFILAYFQQSEEIKANTAALRTQRDEMERQVEAMSEQTAALARTADTLLEHTRPYVICYLRTEGILIEAVLENIGARPAQHVRLSFDPPLQELSNSKFSQAPVEYQPFLAPGQRIVTLLTTGISVLKQADPENGEALLETNATAEYEDLDGKQYRESLVVAKRVIRTAVQQPLSLPKAMKELNDKLKDIRDALRKIESHARKDQDHL